MQSLDFILTRGKATRDAQYAVKDAWIWQKMTLDEWDDQVASFEAQQEVVVDADTAVTARRGTLDAKLATLCRRTVQARAVARAEFADDPEKLALVKSAKDLGDSRDDDMKEGLEWLAVWERLDKAWSPAPGNTFDAFQALYEECRQFEKEYQAAMKAWIEASERLTQRARALDKCSVRWYAVATEVFVEGSYEGDLIRRLVPTTYQPADKSSAPEEPLPDEAMGEPA